MLWFLEQFVTASGLRPDRTVALVVAAAIACRDLCGLAKQALLNSLNPSRLFDDSKTRQRFCAVDLRHLVLVVLSNDAVGHIAGLVDDQLLLHFVISLCVSRGNHWARLLHLLMWRGRHFLSHPAGAQVAEVTAVANKL